MVLRFVLHVRLAPEYMIRSLVILVVRCVIICAQQSGIRAPFCITALLTMKWQNRTIDPQLREPVWCTQSPFSMTSVWNVFLKKRLASETKQSSPFWEISGLLEDYIID